MAADNRRSQPKRRTSDQGRKPGMFRSWREAAWKLTVLAAFVGLCWLAILDWLSIL